MFRLMVECKGREKATTSSAERIGRHFSLQSARHSEFRSSVGISAAAPPRFEETEREEEHNGRGRDQAQVQAKRGKHPSQLRGEVSQGETAAESAERKVNPLRLRTQTRPNFEFFFLFALTCFRFPSTLVL